MSDFKVPINGEIYIHTVQDRCADLISYGIWNGLNQIDIKKWFKNFNGIEEKYFAACVLDYLVYRSESQTEALAMNIFTKNLLNTLRKKGLELDNHRSLINLLRSTTNPNIRLVTIASKMDRPSKSSEIILRMMRRGDLDLNENLFIKPSEVEQEINNGVKYLVFVDDFLGTGNQFTGMVKEFGLNLTFSKVQAVYSPLVAHIEGINNVTKECANLSIVYGEFLNSNSNIFNVAFNDKVNTPISAKNFYDKILDKYGFHAKNGHSIPLKTD